MNDVVALSALILEVLIEEQGKGALDSGTATTVHAATHEVWWSWMRHAPPPG